MFISLRKKITTEKQGLYKQYKTMLKKLLRTAERDYYIDILNKYKCNMKKTWQTIKDIINTKRNNIKQTSFEHNNVKYTDPKDIVEKFNNFLYI